MKLIHLGFIEVNVWKFEARNRRIYQREITMDYFFSLFYCENEISLVFKVFFMRHGFIIENAFRSCANFPSLLLYHIIIIILWYYIIPLGILVGTRKNFHNANVSIIPAL